MIVVGLDPSLTSAGIAILHNGRPALLRSVGHDSRNGSSYAHRSDRIVSQSRAVMAVLVDACAGRNTLDAARNPHVTSVGNRFSPMSFPIDLAVIEGPAYAHANAYTHDCAGLWWGLYSGLRARKIPIAVIAPTTRAKWATGTGRAGKATVLAAVRTTWAPWVKLIANDDIGDALVLAEIGARHLGEELHFPPRRRHVEALAGITWPSISCAKPEHQRVNA